MRFYMIAFVFLCLRYYTLYAMDRNIYAIFGAIYVYIYREGWFASDCVRYTFSADLLAHDVSHTQIRQHSPPPSSLPDTHPTSNMFCPPPFPSFFLPRIYRPRIYRPCIPAAKQAAMQKEVNLARTQADLAVAAAQEHEAATTAARIDDHGGGGGGGIVQQQPQWLRSLGAENRRGGGGSGIVLSPTTAACASAVKKEVVASSADFGSSNSGRSRAEAEAEAEAELEAAVADLEAAERRLSEVELALAGAEERLGKARADGQVAGREAKDRLAAVSALLYTR